MKLQHIDHVAITVTDIASSIEWYSRVLGLEHRPVVEWGSYPQMICAGETCLALFPVRGESQDLSRDERASRLTMQHVAFRVDRAGFEEARQIFQNEGIEVEFADHTICHSLYISDPDGHRIEITTYEL